MDNADGDLSVTTSVEEVQYNVFIDGPRSSNLDLLKVLGHHKKMRNYKHG